MAEVAPKTNLLGMSRESLERYFSSLGEKPFRARQLLQWIYQRGVTDFALMTDLSQKLRERLAEAAEIRPPEILSEQKSADGPSSGCFRCPAGTRSRRSSFPNRHVGRSAFHRRSAACSTARSVLPRCKAAVATFRPPRSLARSGSPIAEPVTEESATWFSWVWANRCSTSTRSDRRWRFCARILPTVWRPGA